MQNLSRYVPSKFFPQDVFVIVLHGDSGTLFISSEKTRKLTQCYEQTYESLLTKLGFHMAHASTIFQEFIQNNLPQKLTESQSRHFTPMIDCLSSNKIHTRSNIVPNGYGVLCRAETLYDHEDPMFLAAFREPSKNLQLFVKKEFRRLRNYWMSIGLRKQFSANAYSPEDYLVCVRAMEARFNRKPIDNNFNADVNTVASYLTWDKQCLHTWSSNDWDEISKASIFTVQKAFPQERNFRQAHMQTLAQRHTNCSLQQSGKREFSQVLGVNFLSSAIHRQTTCTPKFRHASMLTSQLSTNISSF